MQRILPCDAGDCHVTSSNESDVSQSSVTRVPAPGFAAAALRAVMEIGAVATLSCAIMGSACTSRNGTGGGDRPRDASSTVQQPAVQQQEAVQQQAVQQPPVPQEAPQEVPKDGPWIRADPNPVPFAGDKGTTTITWDAAGANQATVCLRGPDKEELFSGGGSGKETIDWIAPGGVYVFVLYADAERTKQLATLKVTRPAK